MLRRELVAVLLAACVLTPARVSVAQSAASSIHRVLVVNEASNLPQAEHGVAQLEQALRARRIEVSESADDLRRSDLVIVAGLSSGGEVGAVLGGKGLPSGAEVLAIRVGIKYKGKPAIVLCGGDAAGLMYAALDLAQRVGWTRSGQSPFVYAKNADEKPFLRDRGVVMFTMNRSYFESRLHDAHYWERYFDMLAEDRLNEVVLTFGYEDGGYMAPLYPFFFNVDGFPDVKVVGLTAAQQKQNFDSFKTMLRLATERGIRIKPGIWEHIYRGGGQRGEITWAPDGKQPTPGMVWGVTTENVVAYTVAALDKFYELFPEIKETQFRLHNESGLLDSEIDSFWHEVFKLYSTRRKDIALEFRAKGLDKSVIRDAQSQGVNVHLDTKIWMEQMGLPYHPTHINTEDQSNARQSYADLLEYPKTYWMNWTLWNGGSQRVLEWSDPEYARRIARTARLYDGPSLMVTEMEATKMLSAPLDVPAHDFINSSYKYFDYEFERYWAFYRVMGRMAYNPDTTADVWEHEYAQRFGAEAGPHVMRALELSGHVMPRIVAASVPYSMFPTTAGWPEMMHLGSLQSYAAKEEGSDIAQFENVRDEASRILAGGETAMRRPEETSYWFSQTSDEILKEVAAAEKSSTGASKELKATLTDAKILAGLARYHAALQMGAVDYNLYKQSGSLPAFDEAIAYQRKAVQAWHEMVDAAGDVYRDDMYFGTSRRGFPHHWKDELPALEKELAELVAERQSAQGKPEAKAVAVVFHPAKQLPVVALMPATAKAQPGVALKVAARVTAPEGIKWIRLRYRHLNQKEDYQTVAMGQGKSGVYEVTIPGEFITPQWDVMYYIEVVDKNGMGRIYPEFEKETPYVVVAVSR